MARETTGGLVFELRIIALRAYWRGDATALPLLGLFEMHSGELKRVMLTDRTALQSGVLAALKDGSSLDEIAVRWQLPVVDPSAPLHLSPEYIAKPWGREIWFTGIEERAVCAVQTATGCCPLPWLIAALPQSLSGFNDRDPVLLKILDPSPEPIIGDLYFELHEVKQEVYVITAIDPSAWPDGQGGIRIGFDPAKRARYASDEAFKQAYQASVERYYEVRTMIDRQLDQHLADQADVATVQRAEVAQRVVPVELQEAEARLRAEMESYTAMYPLSVGDVVVIPRCLPHSLQHGVRAVEFQTPVYERKIVSFAQKVLTQSHWDTQEALEVSRIEDYSPPSMPELFHGAVRTQKIVDFDSFQAFRCDLPAGERFQLTTDGGRYLLLMLVGGSARCGQLELQPEQAVLLPAAALPATLVNSSSEGAQLLFAYPH